MARATSTRTISTKKSLTWSACLIICAAASITIRRRKAEKKRSAPYTRPQPRKEAKTFETQRKRGSDGRLKIAYPNSNFVTRDPQPCKFLSYTCLNPSRDVAGANSQAKEKVP